MKTANEIRRSFLDFFKSRGHEIVPSSPLVPANDPTLLFTNAGMVQFKDLFLGREQRAYKRAASAQRCVRAGGKHNDLENVGYTARHHTFFEMLGNFSFGDYFKQAAIAWAWEYLTGVLKLPEERLWITVFKDDKEAAGVWLDEIGVDPQRFSYCGAKENFWAMGDTGPCGPCSEIFYDHGAQIPGGPPGSDTAELDRYIEIWNLVFTQYNRDPDGRLNPIPRPSVDTGMGLERITAVMQGVHNNYDTELFQRIIRAVQDLRGGGEPELTSSRVVADHIRSCAFLISDGVLPSNERRGYVLRRIIRRAIRHGARLGFKQPFFYKLAGALAEVMGEAYPELPRARRHIEQVLLNEEQRFAETLEQGLKMLDEIIAGLDGRVIGGGAVFRLYDTYGFPSDLTADIARERGLAIDLEGFNRAMAEQKQRARKAGRFVEETLAGADSRPTRFTGYEHYRQKTTLTALYRDGRAVRSLAEGERGGAILAETPFYAESGGQIGDRGALRTDTALFEVEDTQRQGRAHIHLGVMRTGSIRVGDRLSVSVDQARRIHIMRNHSATHLLHAALRKRLGDHVLQKGSLVAADRLRFDFSHTEPLSRAEITQIEQRVNAQILANEATRIRVMPLEKARAAGAMSLFGEKYDDPVRVLNIGGEFSCELCGGTHVERAGDIGLFKITSETGIASGIRRIEAVTGAGALSWVEDAEAKLRRMSELLKTDPESVVARLNLHLEKARRLEKELAQLKGRLASSAGSDMAAEASTIAGVKVIARALDGVDARTLRDTVDQLKNKLGTAALVLASVADSRVSLVAGVTPDNTDRIQAGELVNFVARQVGGRGGGRPDLAQAGGNNPAALPGALEKVPDWIRERLSA